MNKCSENKQGYQKTKLGRIPEDWEFKKLYRCCEFITKGATPTTYGFSWVSHGVLFLRSECVSANGLELEAAMFISDDADKVMRRSSIQEGDILMTITGNVGRVCQVPKGFPKANINQHIARIRITGEGLDQNFIFQYLKQDKIQNEYLKITTGQAYPQISLEQVRNTKIPLPPLPEQKAIASCLTSWDKAIATTQKLIEQKQQKKKWLMQNLLTGKKRLKGFNGEWKEVKLGKLFTEIKNVNDGANGHSIMTISSKLGLVSQKDKFDRVIAGDSLKKYTQLKKDDFAYNKGNSKTYPMGCIYQLEEYESALVPFVYICFSPTTLVDSNFYRQWFLAHGLDRQLKRIITSGARGDGLLNVNKKDFFNLKTVYISKEEQTAIAKILQTADKEIELLQNKLAKLKEQKKGLMQQLLTGKTRILTKIK
ncbi:MAG: restriction endonuclease subunit S [Marinifilaceae bacterium]|nr:restriction endonuclease subunit S [Marinifilaceae bacterium]